MPRAKVALTLDAGLLDQVDLAEKLGRLARTRLATECDKLDPALERRLADEGLTVSRGPNTEGRYPLGRPRTVRTRSRE